MELKYKYNIFVSFFKYYNTIYFKYFLLIFYIYINIQCWLVTKNISRNKRILIKIRIYRVSQAFVKCQTLSICSIYLNRKKYYINIYYKHRMLYKQKYKIRTNYICYILFEFCIFIYNFFIFLYIFCSFRSTDKTLIYPVNLK